MPGEVLLHEFIEPMDLTQRTVADGIGVPYQRLNDVVHGRRALSISTALRLARYFDTTPAFWTNLQLGVDLYNAQSSEASSLAKIVPVRARTDSDEAQLTSTEAQVARC